jgi:REP element-mobilizing transposase RayT
VRLFLAMPDHLHVLAAFPPDQKMESVLRNWKRFVAKQTGVNWQDGFFDHRLRRRESLEKNAYYIRMNRVRAGFVTEPEEWRYVWPSNRAQTAG